MKNRNSSAFNSFNSDFQDNAAINIENEGKRIYNEMIIENTLLGQCMPEFTLVDYPLMDARTNDCTRQSYGKLKQEIIAH